MAILIKLLATKMVANNFFGRLSNLWIRLKLSGFWLRPFSISDFESEKNATSAPEISPEQISKTNINMALNMKEVSYSGDSCKMYDKLGGSMSN